MEIIVRVSFLLGGVVLLLTWSRTRERPLNYFLLKRLDLKARLISLVILAIGALQFLGIFDFKFPGQGSTFAALVSILGLFNFWIGVFLASFGKITLGSNWDPESNHRPLVIQGAYRICRHPIYIGGLWAAFGGEIALQSFFALAVIPGIFLLNRACKDEEAALLKHFGEAYKAYRKRTKRFIVI
ncbi:MAG: hypothetical protein BMS9Abin34_448 [Patescibacteria group bacterium]|nr:MAG: hypothetical protein BMS9Abin34_448 [Patescibacteria group bacterium]